MSIIREEGEDEAGQPHITWYLEFGSDRFFCYTNDRALGGWKIRGGSPPDFRPDRWYHLTVRREATEAAINVTDKGSRRLLWERRLHFDATKEPRIFFEAGANQAGGLRGMRVGNLAARRYLPTEPVCRKAETLFLRLTEHGDAPSAWGNYGLLPDLSQLDSNFQPQNVRTRCDYFTTDGRHGVIVSYALSKDNAREPGRKSVAITVVDAEGQVPLAVEAGSLNLE
jgi:hypothetical protein